MAAPSYTYTLTNGSTADATQVMQDFNDILNGATDGTKDLTFNALTANGAANLKAAVTLGASSANLLTINGALNSTIVLNTDAAFDIGSSTKGLRSVYFGANSQRVRILPSASTSASWTLTLPPTGGTNTYALTTDGSGTASWGVLATTGGGTGTATYASSYGPVYVGLSGTALVGMAAGTTSQVMIGGGVAAAPAWGSVPVAALPAASTSAAGSVTYEDSGTFSATFTGPRNTGALTVNYVRVGKIVTLTVPANNGTSSSGAHFTAATSIPSGLRPTAITQYALVNIQNSGTNSTGMLYVDSAGNLAVFADLNTGNFAATGTVGWGSGPINITYVIA